MEGPESAVDSYSQVARHRAARRALRSSGWWLLGFGVLNLGRLAGSGPPWGPGHAIGAAFGGVMLVAGLVQILRPRPSGVLINGFILLIAAALNGLVAAATFWLLGETPWVAGLFFVMQAAWGISAIRAYPRFREAFASGSTEDELRQLDAFAADLRAADPSAADVVAFRTREGARVRSWKGHLNGDAAAFVDTGGADLIFAPRALTEFVAVGEADAGLSLAVTARLGRRLLAGTMTRDAFLKYESWKAGQGDDETARALIGQA